MAGATIMSSSSAAVTASERRAASDERKRAQGQERIGLWLSAASIEALDALVATWGLGGRTQGVEIAIRHLADQLGRGVMRISAIVDGCFSAIVDGVSA